MSIPAVVVKRQCSRADKVGIWFPRLLAGSAYLSDQAVHVLPSVLLIPSLHRPSLPKSTEAFAGTRRVEDIFCSVRNAPLECRALAKRSSELCNVRMYLPQCPLVSPRRSLEDCSQPVSHLTPVAKRIRKFQTNHASHKLHPTYLTLNPQTARGYTASNIRLWSLRRSSSHLLVSRFPCPAPFILSFGSPFRANSFICALTDQCSPHIPYSIPTS